MFNLAKIKDVESKIRIIRDQKVILDSDVANLYSVEIKRINEAVKNNQDKFPYGYVFELNEIEFTDLRSKISTANLSKTRIAPKAFTEKGCYMLATILKSKIAVKTTINIIETFSKTRELSRTVGELITITEETK